MKSATLRFWGVRGSVPTPGPDTVRYGGNTACVELRIDGQILILDAGTGLHPLGWSLVEEFPNTPLDLHILLSHAHWDHIQGLPFFYPAWKAGHRLHILGGPGNAQPFSEILAGQMRTPYFPVSLDELASSIEIGEWSGPEFTLCGLPIRAHRASHPGICHGYRIETPGGAVVYLPDNEPQVHKLQILGETSLEKIAEAERADAALLDFIRDAAILITDSQYTAAAYATKAGWGHSCAETVTQLALQAGVRRLYLFHHDPNQTDAQIDAKLAACRAIAAGSNLQVEAASEGLVVKVE